MSFSKVLRDTGGKNMTSWSEKKWDSTTYSVDMSKN